MRIAVALSAAGIVAGIALAIVLTSPAEVRPVTHPSATRAEHRPAARPKPPVMPGTLDGARDVRDLRVADSIPRGARALSTDHILRAPQQLIVTWEDLGRDESDEWAGVAIWQKDRGDATAWHRAYSLEKPTVFRYVVRVGDVSGDARRDVVLFEDGGGSAGCGFYRVLVNAGRKVRTVFGRELCQDAGTIEPRHGALVTLRGTGRFQGGGIHCCYRNVRETWRRWNGRRMVVVGTAVRPNRRGWLPR